MHAHSNSAHSLGLHDAHEFTVDNTHSNREHSATTNTRAFASTQDEPEMGPAHFK